MPDRSTHLTRMLHLLWSESAAVTYPHRLERVGRVGVDLAVLPSMKNPKLILPRRPLRATSAAIRNYKASASRQALIKLRVLSLAARIGLGNIVLDRIHIAGTDAGIDEYLRSVLSCPVIIALYVGPPRAVEKPILQLLSPDGVTFAFAKLGTNPLTRALVRNEVASIRTIKSAAPRILRTPDVLHEGQWNGHELIVQSAISPGGSRSRVEQLLPSATQELMRVNGVRSHDWTESPYRAKLIERTDRLARSPYACALAAALRRVDGLVGTTRLSFGSWHGDWAPWNMTVSGQHVVAWDWEHFESDIPLGFDAVHHDVASLVLFGAVPPDLAFERVVRGKDADLTRAVIAPADRSLIVCLYLLEIATRYIEDDEVGVAGTPMSRLGEWLSAALESCLGALARDRQK